MTTALKSLDEVLADIRKEYGEHAVVHGSDLKNYRMNRITTGVLSFDAAMGGGWPTNQFHQIVGEFSAGKSLLAQRTIIANQQANPDFQTLYIAAEPLDYPWLVKQGMDLDRVEVVPTRSMEQAYDIVIRYTQNRLCDLVVIDSLPALVVTEEDNKDFSELTIGKGAIVNNRFYNRKGANAIARSLVEPDRDVTVLVINQYREKIGVNMPGADTRTTPGGKGKDFAFYVSVEMRGLEWIKLGKKPVGRRFRMSTTKNKSAPVKRSAEVNFYFDNAPGYPAGQFDVVDDMFLAAITYDLLGSGGGGIYSFGDTKIKGKEKFLERLREDLDLQQDIREAVLQVVTPGASDKPAKGKVSLVK